MKVIGMRELRRHTGPIVRVIAQGGEPVLITKWGRPCFVGMGWDTYCALPLEVEADWSMEEELSTEGFRRRMSSLVYEQREWIRVAVVRYSPFGQPPFLEQVYKAIFLPPWMVKDEAEDLGGEEMVEALSEVEKPDWAEPKAKRWKSCDFRIHISEAVAEAEKDLLAVKRYKEVVLYIVPIGSTLNLGLPFLAMADLGEPVWREWGKASLLTRESLDAIWRAPFSRPIRLPEPLTRDIQVVQVTITELRERWSEVLESRDRIYVVMRYTTPVCAVFPADLFMAIKRFVGDWWLGFRKGLSCLAAFRKIKSIMQGN